MTKGGSCPPPSVRRPKSTVMDDRPDNPEAIRDGGISPTVLVVQPCEHAVAAAVTDELRRLGWPVSSAANMYDATADIARDPARFAAAIVAVDYLNHNELRFFPMAVHRWPALRTAAVSRPGFAHKAAIAELAGADAMCTDVTDAAGMVARLDLPPSAELGIDAEPVVEMPRTAAVVRTLPDRQPKETGLPVTAAHQAEPPTALSADRAGSREAGVSEDATAQRNEPGKAMTRPAPPRKPPTGPAATPVRPNDILTAEEITALMAEFDDEDSSPGESSDE